MHIYWGKAWDAFENQHWALEQSKFGSIVTLNALINISSVFCDNRKILILPIIWCIC